MVKKQLELQDLICTALKILFTKSSLLGLLELERDNLFHFLAKLLVQVITKSTLQFSKDLNMFSVLKGVILIR